MKAFAPGGLVLLVLTSVAPGSSTSYATRDLSTVGDTLACADTLRPSDTIAAIVKISVRHQDTTSKLPADFELLFADEFRSRFKPPSQLPLVVMRADPRCDAMPTCASISPTVGVVAYAIVSPDGTIPMMNVISPSLNRELADSVRSVLVSISNAKVPFFEFDKRLPIAITINVEVAPDSVPLARQLFRVKLPHYTGQFRHATATRSAFPRYPRDAESRGVGDTVEFQFTVLADGRVAPQSLDVVRYHYREFLESVTDLLARAVYKPATLGGCPVPQWVRQTFQFATPQFRIEKIYR